jgi:hypothetical protein
MPALQLRATTRNQSPQTKTQKVAGSSPAERAPESLVLRVFCLVGLSSLPSRGDGAIYGDWGKHWGYETAKAAWGSYNDGEPAPASMELAFRAF